MDLSAECVLTAVLLGGVLSVVLAQEMPESEEEVEVEQGPARAGLRSKAVSLGAGLHRLHLHRPGYDDPDGETQAQEQISFLHSKCK